MSAVVFEKLRSKVVGRHGAAPPSEEAIRAHVLGEIHAPGTPPFPPTPVAPPTQQGRYAAAFEGLKPGEAPSIPEITQPEFEEPPSPQFRPEPRGFERRTEERGVSYEIIDRLEIIEAQLATIRAQTETLNERMKTIEMYVRSRMPRTGF